MSSIPKYRMIEQHYFERISDGTLRHNDKLPTEFQIMQEFGVSRITVTKAMKELEKRGVIVRHTKTGTFVNCRNRSILKQLTIPIVLPYNNLLNFDIIRGAQKFALINSAVIPFYNTFNDPAQEREILLSLERMNIDGLLLYPCSGIENIDILSRFDKRKLPLVFLDREVPGANAPLVTADNAGGMHRLVKALFRMGYRRFGFCGGTQNLFIEKDRFDGFCSALLENSVEIRPDWLFPIENEISRKYRSAQLVAGDEDLQRSARQTVEAWKALETKPEVICCTNDFLAESILKAAREGGVSVPEELGITGFDGISLTAAGTPAVATVVQDFDGIGKSGLEAVCRIIGGETPDRRILIPTKNLLAGSVCRRE